MGGAWVALKFVFVFAFLVQPRAQFLKLAQHMLLSSTPLCPSAMTFAWQVPVLGMTYKKGEFTWMFGGGHDAGKGDA